MVDNTAPQVEQDHNRQGQHFSELEAQAICLRLQQAFAYLLLGYCKGGAPSQVLCPQGTPRPPVVLSASTWEPFCPSGDLRAARWQSRAGLGLTGPQCSLHPAISLARPGEGPCYARASRKMVARGSLPGPAHSSLSLGLHCVPARHHPLLGLLCCSLCSPPPNYHRLNSPSKVAVGFIPFR